MKCHRRNAISSYKTKTPFHHPEIKREAYFFKPTPLPMSSLLFLLLLLTTPNPIQPSNLDPKQLTALQSMSIPTVPDPCSPLRNSTTTCDHSSPFRRLLSLSLSHCSPSLSLSSTALRSLSSLLSLSLSLCPLLPPFPFPPHLLSLSLSSSFHRLSAISLSHLHSLTHLSLTSVPVHCTGAFVFLSQMPNLIESTVSSCNLSGSIPRHFPSLNLTLLNLSNNTLTGTIPPSLSNLIYLQNLSLSNNRLSGPIPTSMSALPLLAHLDLSSNNFNGTVPGFLAEMRDLAYLNLEDNEFVGELPFNETFIKRLKVLRISGNVNLCYNRSLVSRKVELGIAECDRYGLPVSPPPDRSSGKSDYGDDGGDGEDDGEEDRGGRKGGGGNGGGGHHGPSALVLGVAIGLACLVFLVIFVVCLSKICG